MKKTRLVTYKKALEEPFKFILTVESTGYKIRRWDDLNGNYDLKVNRKQAITFMFAMDDAIEELIKAVG
jgi:hypothetical protein